MDRDLYIVSILILALTLFASVAFSMPATDHFETSDMLLPVAETAGDLG